MPNQRDSKAVSLAHPVFSPAAVPSSLTEAPADNKVDPSTKFPPGEFIPDERPTPEGADPIFNTGPALLAKAQGTNPPAHEGTINYPPPLAKWPSMSPGLSNEGKE